MTDIAAIVAANAEALVQLHSRIHETLARRFRSEADRDRWVEACAEFHRRFPELIFPGGLKHWEAFLSGAPEEIESAITFLEVDPWFFRSGYLKQIVWGRIKRASLTVAQQDRLEAVALAYLKKRVHLEFWYMVRFVRACGTDSFWHQVAAIARTDQSDVGNKAGWLLLAKQNHPVKNWVGRECRRARYEPGYVPNLRFHSVENAA
jgi:hypothetical protein